MYASSMASPITSTRRPAMLRSSVRTASMGGSLNVVSIGVLCLLHQVLLDVVGNAVFKRPDRRSVAAGAQLFDLRLGEILIFPGEIFGHVEVFDVRFASQRFEDRRGKIGE